MELNDYLDTVDRAIMGLLKSGTVSKGEALDLQNKAYEFENFSYGLNWLNKKIDYLSK